MKKKWMLCYAAALLALCLGGCGKEAEPTDMIKEVSDLPDATITIPTVLVGSEADELLPVKPEETAADADADAETDETSETASGEEAGQSPTVTYQIDGDTRTELVNGIASQLQESIDQILADKYYYPNISDIKVNEDATEFTIYLTNDTPNLYESTLLLSFYTVGNKYQIYNGVPSEDAVTTVVYVNSESGEELARSDSSSMH